MSNDNQKNSGRWFWGIFISLLVMSFLFVGLALIMFSMALVKTGDKNFDYEEIRTGKG